MNILHRAEATPDGVNIMTRNDAGMYEHVALINYEKVVVRLDAGEYPLEVIRLKVTEYLFFAAGHSHAGGLLIVG